MNLQELLKVVSDVKFKNFVFVVKSIGMDSHVLYIEAIERDHVSGEPMLLQGRKFLIPPTMSKSDFVRTCFAAVMAWQEHETREEFSYRGMAIFDPHFDVDAAAEHARRYASEARPK